MNNALMVLALTLVLIMIVIFGCIKQSQPSTTPSTEEQSANNTITGQIQDVDKLNSELNDSDLEDIDSQLNDINW